MLLRHYLVSVWLLPSLVHINLSREDARFLRCLRGLRHIDEVAMPAIGLTDEAIAVYWLADPTIIARVRRRARIIVYHIL